VSQFTELAAKFQEQQVEAVKASQDAFIKLVESFTSATPAPAEVDLPEPVKEALKPAYDFFGTPDEVAAYFAEATKVWTKIGQDFQNQVVAQLTKGA
jgi:hypothetical protein